MDNPPAQGRYHVGRNGVFATLYDRETGRVVVDNSTTARCHHVRDRLLAQAHDLDELDAAFAALAPGHPARTA